MTENSLSSRARETDSGAPPVAAGERWLAHPLAFVVTALALVLIFSWTFIANPGRVAPGDDPAFYTWRTEALLSEEPATLLETTGPMDVLAGGYRVTTPVFGGLLRGTLGIVPETTTMILTVAMRVLIALLLAGFAYRHRPDPLVFHAVAFGAAGLMLTPPFYGYLDNLFCLLFLTASLFLLERVRSSWPARAVFFVLLFLAGMTHPTTLVFFCIVLGAMASLRLLLRRLDLRSVLRDDIPVLVAAGAAALAVVLVWRIGAWGPSVSLSEAAVPPPADEGFFFTRLVDWVDAMRPLLNGPLLAVGLVTVLSSGRRAGESEFDRVALAWLLPLAGVFGFVAGFAYPYYRFFNTTLAWVLLVGFGAAVAARFFIVRARTAGPLALLGVVAVAVVLATNFGSGWERWTDPGEGWLTDAQQREFGLVRQALASSGGGRPVVFAIDTDVTERVRVYGFMKFSANVSRHALPHGYVDRGYIFLGSVGDLQAGRATAGRSEAYREISEATLEDVRSVRAEPIVVVAESFNGTGANASLFDDEQTPPGVWLVSGDCLARAGEADVCAAEQLILRPPSLRWIIPAAGLALLSLIGLAAAGGLLPGVTLAESLGLAPALAMALLTFAGFVVLALARAPLSTALACAAVALAAAAGGALWLRGTRA